MYPRLAIDTTAVRMIAFLPAATASSMDFSVRPYGESSDACLHGPNSTDGLTLRGIAQP